MYERKSNNGFACSLPQTGAEALEPQPVFAWVPKLSLGVCYSAIFMMRFAAFLLLALMCVDIGHDVMYGERGDFPALSTSPSSDPVGSVRANPSESGPGAFTHECFCCCSHIEHQERVTLRLLFTSTPGFSQAVPTLPEAVLRPITHPPQTV